MLFILKTVRDRVFWSKFWTHWNWILETLGAVPLKYVEFPAYPAILNFGGNGKCHLSQTLEKNDFEQILDLLGSGDL